MPKVIEKAQAMVNTYSELGYSHCRVLTLAEALTLDPSLEDFIRSHSSESSDGKQWHSHVTAIWRPGGCIDCHVFLPQFYGYLSRKMGEYLGKDGRKKPCFRIKYGKEVVGVSISNDEKGQSVDGLTIVDQLASQPRQKRNSYPYASSTYAFCPGQSVGSLKRFGFKEPPYANFAGPSLKLKIPLSKEQIAALQIPNNCMEIHKPGVVLAWQARLVERDQDTYLSIKVGGTKAFYGEECPKITEAFATNRNLLQLRMIYDVMPQAVAIALQVTSRSTPTTSSELTLTF